MENTITTCRVVINSQSVRCGTHKNVELKEDTINTRWDLHIALFVYMRNMLSFLSIIPFLNTCGNWLK